MRFLIIVGVSAGLGVIGGDYVAQKVIPADTKPTTKKGLTVGTQAVSTLATFAILNRVF